MSKVEIIDGRLYNAYEGGCTVIYTIDARLEVKSDYNPEERKLEIFVLLPNKTPRGGWGSQASLMRHKLPEGCKQVRFTRGKKSLYAKLKNSLNEFISQSREELPQA